MEIAPEVCGVGSAEVKVNFFIHVYISFFISVRLQKFISLD